MMIGCTCMGLLDQYLDAQVRAAPTYRYALAVTTSVGLRHMTIMETHTPLRHTRWHKFHQSFAPSLLHRPAV